MTSSNLLATEVQSTLGTEEHHITQVEKVYNYKWTINNFSCKKANRQNLPSTSFDFYSGSIFTNTIVLSIKGLCENRTCDLQLKGSWVNVHVELRVEEPELLSSSKDLGDLQTQLSLSLTKNCKDCLLCKGSLKINCQLTLMEYITYAMPKLCLQNSMGADLELFKSKKYSDIKFLVSDHILYAHKCILASRNSVFAAMFHHEMEESKTNHITIEDISVEVFEDLLRFLYTGDVLHMKKFSIELLAASEKYDVQNLKSMCINELIGNILVENAAEMLTLADLYRAQDLKTAVFRFLKTKRKEVADTEGWKNIISNNAAILADLFLET